MEKINWLNFRDNNNLVLEAYRIVCTSFLGSIKNVNVRLITMTSPEDKNEKSKVIAGLAIVLAQEGKRTLVVDGNFNGPVQHILFGITNQGITDCIECGTDFYTMIQPCMEQDNLDILSYGSVAIPSGKIMGSETMHRFLESIKNEYDFILIDAPPVQASTNAIVLSPKTDGVVFVVTRGEDRLNALIEAKSKLEKAGANLIGCIFNNAKVTL